MDRAWSGCISAQRVGVPWLGWTCGHCRYCRQGRENLCSDARFTGCQIDGGFAELTLADERYCFALPERYGNVEAAPLLCAGLIGYRALRMAGEAKTLGLYGFGAAAHIIAQVAKQQGRRVFAFTRPSDLAAQRFAVELGCDWAGSSPEMPPALLDAALIFAPVGELIPAALQATDKGGTVICAGIHMSDIPSFPYRILWQERILRSVANLTRADAEEFLALAAQMPIRTHTEAFALADANVALSRLKHGELLGAAVLVPSLSTPGQYQPDIAREAPGEVEDPGGKVESPRLQLPFPAEIDLGRLAAQALGPVGLRRVDRPAAIGAEAGRESQQKEILLAMLGGDTRTVQQGLPIAVDDVMVDELPYPPAAFLGGSVRLRPLAFDPFMLKAQSQITEALG